MNLAELQSKLLKAAQANPPDDAVPYAFEKRIMARLASLAPVDIWACWSRALWRAAVSCVAITLLSSVWTLWLSHHQPPAMDFSQEFETAVFIVASHVEESW